MLIGRFTPDQVRAMSLWDFRALEDGYAAAHPDPDDKSLSLGEWNELAAMIPVSPLMN